MSLRAQIAGEPAPQPKPPALRRRPFIYRLKAQDIDSTSPVAAELRAADVIPHGAGPLSSGRPARDVDNLPALGWADVADQVGVDRAADYLDRQGVIDALVREARGEPVRSADQVDAAAGDALAAFRDKASHDIDRFISDFGFTLTPAEREQAMEAALAGDDIEAVIERTSEREVDDAEDRAGYAVGEDIPGWDEPAPAEAAGPGGSRADGPERAAGRESARAAREGSSSGARSHAREGGSIDLTPEGAQRVIPGAERITDQALAERRMAQPKRGGDAPLPGGSLFDDDARAQADMFSDAGARPGAGGLTESERAEILAERFARTRPVAVLSGLELGDHASIGDLREAARRWYGDNLRGTSTTTADGKLVRFNRAGMMKSTSKGEDLLRLIPAIKAIVEKGSLIDSREGNRVGIKAVHFYAASVSIGGAVKQVAIAIRETHDGAFHYDLTWMQREGKAARSRSETDGDAERSAVTPALEGAPGEINIAILPAEFNGATPAALARAAAIARDMQRRLDTLGPNVKVANVRSPGTRAFSGRSTAPPAVSLRRRG